MQACDKYREMMSAMIDGELSKEEQSELKAHLDICPECEQAYAMFSLLHEEISELDVDVPEELSSHVMRSVHNISKKPSFLSRFKFTAAAAVIVLIIYAASGPIQKYLPKTDTVAPSVSQEKETKNKTLSDIPMKISGGPVTEPKNSATPNTNVTPKTQDTTKRTPSTTTNQPYTTDKSINSTEQESHAHIPTAPKSQTDGITPDKAETPIPKKEVADGTINKQAPNAENIQPEASTVLPPTKLPVTNNPTTSVQEKETPKGNNLEKNDTPVSPPDNALPDAKKPETQNGGESNYDSKPSLTPPTSVGSSGGGSAGGNAAATVTYALPEVPYSEDFAFYIIVKKVDIPETLKNHRADIYKNNLFFKVETNLENAILSELNTNTIPYTRITGEKKGLTQGLFIILND